MGVEVAQSNIDVVEPRHDEVLSVDGENVDIKFGSHVVDEPVKKEAVEIAESNLPKDAVDEWPEPKQVYSFYVVRYRTFEDQKLKAKLDLADKELQKKNQARLQIVEKIKAKRAARFQIIEQLKALNVENKQFRSIMDEKRKEMEPLQQALGKLRGPSGGGGREKGSVVICSSEQELNDVIKSLQYRIQHESIPLKEEKQILREIKQLEGTREKVIAFAAERARIQDSMGEKDAIQGQVKSIGVDLDGVRKEKQVINAKVKQLDEEKMSLDKDILALEGELTAITQKRDQTFENIKDLRKQREEGNSPFYKNRTFLTQAKSVAANKDVDALRELTHAEVEKFMSLWNSGKAFRDDYEKRILSSLDMRQLSKDGRLRNPGEKPLVQPETTTSEPVVVKPIAKQTPKEDAPSPAEGDTSEQKAQKAKSGKNTKEGNKKKETASEKIDTEEQEEFFISSLPKKVEPQINAEKLKELKKEEEIAKRNQAEERKRKLAEKAASKAAIKAQKEAEKKLKEREKKARKKAGTSAAAVADSEQPTEEDTTEVTEPEEVEEKTEPVVPQKNKERKNSTVVRQRGRARGGPDSLPKAILKRKKATNYWAWAGPAAAAAAVVILLLLFLGYNYLG